ncbi:hypothetical protein DB32_007586 [Sandaracinus amylolyticus]|uniref:Uncharacterized protein n=1 Tax=Sandaracinus amylolyticus TaxID=927083 RepID=A0A0F6W8X2_9BACT|nr:hypothetical protein DB32_007586 [Sandaracinus amylolyticus]
MRLRLAVDGVAHGSSIYGHGFPPATYALAAVAAFSAGSRPDPPGPTRTATETNDKTKKRRDKGTPAPELRRPGHVSPCFPEKGRVPDRATSDPAYDRGRYVLSHKSLPRTYKGWARRPPEPTTACGRTPWINGHRRGGQGV